MANFRDNQGREWSVVINGRVLARARKHGGLNVGDLFSAAASAEGGRVVVDPALLLELCFYGCEHNSRIQTRKVDKDEFLEMLTGKALADAIQATAAALTECFAAPEQKEAPAAGSDPIGGQG